ncbi:MAG: glucose-6-phosphate isomerase [Pseudomonadota bacterium]
MTTQDAWSNVHREAARLKPVSLKQLFAEEADRFDHFAQEACGLLVDISKEKLDRPALQALVALAEAVSLKDKIAALFDADHVNATEGRAALHMALRDGVDEGLEVDGEAVMPAVRAERDRMLAFATAVRSGDISAADGAPFSDVINLGIGGSDLGPAMGVRALTPWHDGPRIHFVSNVDGTALADTIRHLDPRRTLVIVASKSFTTLETMANARSALSWLKDGLGDQTSAHLAAISTNPEATRAFGVPDDRVFRFWDWVGGRYSLWGVIGLPLAIAIGADAFKAFLSGAAQMDQHFRKTPLTENLPVLLGLVGVWRRNAMGCASVACLPYEERLGRLPAYLQQLDMESNGKRVSVGGDVLEVSTAGVIFGEPGTNSQHSFFQMLHQGTDVVPVDFLVGTNSAGGIEGHHDALFGSALAQAAALAFGRDEDAVRALLASNGVDENEIDRIAPHRTFPGDRPSTMICYSVLDPRTLGAVVALFEHRTYVQSVLWGINAFDQYGVELGKTLTTDLMPRLGVGDLSDLDSSTRGMIERYRTAREQ